MDLGLHDRVVLVTGGGSGIGEAITRACLQEGAQVAVIGRLSPAALQLQAEMRSNLRCTFVEAELAEPDHCSHAVERVHRQYGRIDALVNNAGSNDSIGLAQGTPARFLESLRQNLLHYYAMAHYCLPMLKESQGSIVNISSKVAVTGQGGSSAYAAAKGAQFALTREWAAELLPAGMRVNCVVPAEVQTPLYQDWLALQEKGDEALQAIERRIPLGHRMTMPAEIAAAVVFLLSPTQSAHTTGQQVFVDGGYTHLDRALTVSPKL